MASIIYEMSRFLLGAKRFETANVVNPDQYYALACAAKRGNILDVEAEERGCELGREKLKQRTNV